MTLPRQWNDRPKPIALCWGCGLPDATHGDADRFSCREGFARAVAEVAALHRRNLVGCGCSACLISAAADREAARQPRKLVLS